MRLVQYLLFSRRLSSVADPGSGSGMGKKSGSGMNNPDHISESLKTIFWVNILKFFDADPGSEIRNGKVRIRDKLPGSATQGSSPLVTKSY
jgi:hypothetical protein